MKRAVFLDRDGVLNQPVIRNRKPYPPSSAENLVIPAGAAESLHRLKAAGFVLLVATNQPDVARGTQSRADVERINHHLSSLLPVQEFFVCYHDESDGCQCRKPRPGLLRAAAVLHGIDLSSSFMIGDRWRDIEAGAAAGCRTILIDFDYDERKPDPPPDVAVSNLTEAADWILRRESLASGKRELSCRL